MAKAAVAENRTTALVAGDVTFTITDPTVFKTLKMDGGANSLLRLLRQNYAASGWEPVLEDGADIYLSARRRTVTPAEVGVYSVEGPVAGTITLWTEDIT